MKLRHCFALLAIGGACAWAADAPQSPIMTAASAAKTTNTAAGYVNSTPPSPLRFAPPAPEHPTNLPPIPVRIDPQALAPMQVPDHSYIQDVTVTTGSGVVEASPAAQQPAQTPYRVTPLIRFGGTEVIVTPQNNAQTLYSQPAPAPVLRSSATYNVR